MRIVRDQIEVLQRAEGFYDAAVLMTLVRLGIFRLIDSGVRSAGDMAREIGAHPALLRRLLRAAAAMRILSSEEDDCFSLGDPCFKCLLPSAGSACIEAWIQYLDMHRRRMDHLERALVGALPVEACNEIECVSDAHTHTATWAMHSYAATRGRELLDHLDLRGARSLVDVGCGPGTYAFMLAAKYPELEITLLDRKAVLEVAREVAKQFELSKSPTYVPGDITTGVLEGVFDVVLVSNCLQAVETSARSQLLATLFQHVSAGGSIVIQGQFLHADRPGPRFAHLVDLKLLCEGGQAGNHSAEAVIQQLEEAGFEQLEYIPMSLLNTNSLVRAYKSKACAL